MPAVVVGVALVVGDVVGVGVGDDIVTGLGATEDSDDFVAAAKVLGATCWLSLCAESLGRGEVERRDLAARPWCCEAAGSRLASWLTSCVCVASARALYLLMSEPATAGLVGVTTSLVISGFGVVLLVTTGAVVVVVSVVVVVVKSLSWSCAAVLWP